MKNMSQDKTREILNRAIRLAMERGEASPKPDDLPIRIYHMDEDYVIDYLVDKRIIVYRKTQPRGPVCALDLSDNSIAGNFTYHLYDTIRKAMVLEDLADL